MKTDDAVAYLVARALDSGYTPEMVAGFRAELRERVSEMKVCDKEELDEIFDQWF